MRVRAKHIFMAPVALLLAACCGCCGKPTYETVPVTGTVKYADGAIPQGEVAIVQFVPANLSDGKTKAASGDIKSDGTFELTTVNPGDGAFPGDYKVTLTIGVYGEKDSVIDAKYTDPGTTPLSATVKNGKNDPFPFTIDKKE